MVGHPITYNGRHAWCGSILMPVLSSGCLSRSVGSAGSSVLAFWWQNKLLMPYLAFGQPQIVCFIQSVVHMGKSFLVGGCYLHSTKSHGCAWAAGHKRWRKARSICLIVAGLHLSAGRSFSHQVRQDLSSGHAGPVVRMAYSRVCVRVRTC